MLTTTSQPDVDQTGTDMREAAVVAGLAPSIHNTQPWRWRIRPAALELWADRTRQLPASDPDGRMLTISCGAALHHARIYLAAQGYRTLVLPYPDPDYPDHVAHLGIIGRTPVTDAATRRCQAVALRRTDRRPVLPRLIDDKAFLALSMAAQAQGCYLHPLRRDQVIELASTVAHAQDAQLADDAWRDELATWAGGTRPDGTGIPDANIPDRQPQTTVAQRDFDRPGTLHIGNEHDTAATYAILYGEQDDRLGWLDAGQALSALWLAATVWDVSVMPLSAPIEIPSTRQAVRATLSGIGYPYLVLRFGTTGDGKGPAPTPRIPPDRIITTEDE
ncbi:Acg family FMN-binding oxidoreductase [Rugosimonospora africana]|uniref:NAD(P)H nitroreductase n=1 Tax=Rugosimonospora africana TaxID=556532 RepID=A0A8J3VWQ4_9ACTN|nr:nitroreductase [Rugosimonospora africana]GIH21101.1 NAD(P)H nitroreductase [Rugosimonospora africana]